MPRMRVISSKVITWVFIPAKESFRCAFWAEMWAPTSEPSPDESMNGTPLKSMIRWGEDSERIRFWNPNTVCILNGPFRLTTRWPAWGPSVTTACMFSMGTRRDCRAQSGLRWLKFCYSAGSISQRLWRLDFHTVSPERESCYGWAKIRKILHILKLLFQDLIFRAV